MGICWLLEQYKLESTKYCRSQHCLLETRWIRLLWHFQCGSRIRQLRQNPISGLLRRFITNLHASHFVIEWANYRLPKLDKSSKYESFSTLYWTWRLAFHFQTVHFHITSSSWSFLIVPFVFIHLPIDWKQCISIRFIWPFSLESFRFILLANRKYLAGASHYTVSHCVEPWQ